MIASSPSKPSLRRDTHMQSYTISHGHPLHNPSPSPPPTPRILHRFSGNDTYSHFCRFLFSHPILLIVVSSNACVLLHCPLFALLLSFAAAYQSPHTITTPHSGPSSSIIAPSPPSLLPFYHTSLCHLLVSAPENPRSPCDGYMVSYVLMFSRFIFPHSLLYAFIPSHSPCSASRVRFPKLSCPLQSRLYHYCLFRT